MTERRASVQIYLCFPVALIAFIFISSCSLFKTPGGVAESRERQMGRGETVRGSFELLPDGDVRSHYALGCSYQRLGQHEEAIAEFEKAIIEKPDFVEARNKLGLSYSSLGRLELAEEVYLAALDIKPGTSYLYNNLGYSYLLQGKWDAAVEAFKRAVELNGDRVDSRMYNNLGLAYAMAGDYDGAMRVFQRVFGEAEANYRMARVYSRLGMTDEARKHYLSAAGLDPSSSVYAEAVEKCKQAEEFSEFIDQVKKAVGTVDPTAYGKNRAKLSAPPGIEISNGNGVLRMAHRVGRFLKNRGFSVVRFTNAGRFTCPETIIQFEGEYEIASVELAKVMPELPRRAEVAQLDRRNVKIKMLLGKDIVRDNKAFAKENR